MARELALVPRPDAFRRLRRAIGHGMLAVGFVWETAAKRHTPVRGGYRSFQPDGPVGGTLRRSVHTVAYVDGERISPRPTDDNGQALPDYVPGEGIAVFVGTNSGYGGYVHNGTAKMPARPFLEEGLADVRPVLGRTLAAGTRKAMGT